MISLILEAAGYLNCSTKKKKNQFENYGPGYEVHILSQDSSIRLTMLDFKVYLPSWQLSIQRHHTVLVSSASPRSLPPNGLREQT